MDIFGGCPQVVHRVIHRVWIKFSTGCGYRVVDKLWIRLSTGLFTGCGYRVVGCFGCVWEHLPCWCFCASTIYRLAFLRLSQSVLRCSQDDPHTTNTHTFTPAFAGRMRNRSAGHINRDSDANKKKRGVSQVVSPTHSPFGSWIVPY